MVLKDFGTIDDKTLTTVINQIKLIRECQKSRQKLRTEEHKYKMVDTIYIDGQKEATLTTIKISHSKFYSKIKIEEHYIIVEKPGKLYLTRFSVEEGKSRTIAKLLTNCQSYLQSIRKY